MKYDPEPGMSYNRSLNLAVFGCLGGLALVLAVGFAAMILDWLR